jgi:TMEM175 potassium channel family protein
MKPEFTGGSLDKARLDTLVDAVYAIALTLLVLDLKLPEGLRTFEVPGHLRDMLPKIGIYAIAFSTVALLWVCHHYYSTVVTGTDFTHVMLNLSPLLLVALIPFSAAAMGTYHDSKWAVATFTLNVAVICFLYVLNWAHCRRRLVPASLDRGLLDTMTANAWYSLAGEIVATILAFIMPVLGIAVAALMVPAGFAAMARLEPRIMKAVKES